MKKFPEIGRKEVYIAIAIGGLVFASLITYLVLRRKMISWNSIQNQARKIPLIGSVVKHFAQSDRTVNRITGNDFLLDFNSHTNSQNITLDEVLLLVGLPSLLCELDYSNKEVIEGKSIIEEHDKFFRERAITQLNKLSLKYHPDKQKDKTDDMQKLVNNTKTALEGIHEKVKKKLGARYQLFGVISVNTIVNAINDDSTRSNRQASKMEILVGSGIINALGRLIKYRQGFLMSARNCFLQKTHYVDNLKNFLNNPQIIMHHESIKKEIDCSSSNIEEYVILYVQNYARDWLGILEGIKKSCKEVESMKCIESEIDKLLKTSKKEYKILEECVESFQKKEKIKLVQDADVCFVQPVIHYANLTNIYSIFLNRLSEKKHSLGITGIISCIFPVVDLPATANCTEAIDFEQEKERFKEDCKTIEISELSDICYELIDYYFDKKLPSNKLLQEIGRLSKEEIKEMLIICTNYYRECLDKNFKHIETYLERQERIGNEIDRIIQETLQKKKEFDEARAKRIEAEEERKQAEEEKRQAEERVSRQQLEIQRLMQLLERANTNAEGVELVENREQQL
jgi:hypothetical protein